jgi:hypothetical protein
MKPPERTVRLVPTAVQRRFDLPGVAHHICCQCLALNVSFWRRDTREWHGRRRSGVWRRGANGEHDRRSTGARSNTRGRGIKSTLLQAFASGCPSVATTAAVASTGAVPGRDACAAANPEQFADEVLRMLSDRTLRSEMADNAFAYVSAKHSIEITRAAFRDVLTRHAAV